MNNTTAPAPRQPGETAGDHKQAVMDLFSELNVVFEGCPPNTARYVFDEVISAAGLTRNRPQSWADFSIRQLNDAAFIFRARRVRAHAMRELAEVTA